VTKKKKTLSNDIKDLIEYIESDIQNHKVILDAVNKNAGSIMKILDSQDDVLMDIKYTQKHISDNTNDIAVALATYSEQNTKLVDAVAGKKQVPISVFLMVLLIVGIASLAMLVSISNVELIINPNQIEIKNSENGTTKK